MVERAATERDIVERHLTRAWRALTPAPHLREQVRARLTSSTAASMGALGLGMASNARPVGAWASLQASGKLGALVGAVLVGVGLVSGYLIRNSREEAPRPAELSTWRSEGSPLVALPQPASVPERESGDAELVPPGVASRAPRAEPLPPPLSPAIRQRTSTASSPPRAAPRTDITTAKPSDELALLRRAERAVRTGNPALALALIGELEERHPRSSLLEERRAIELMAYCRAGATDAGARSQRFLREYPESAYAGRIRELCPAAPARAR